MKNIRASFFLAGYNFVEIGLLNYKFEAIHEFRVIFQEYMLHSRDARLGTDPWVPTWVPIAQPNKG